MAEGQTDWVFIQPPVDGKADHGPFTPLEAIRVQEGFIADSHLRRVGATTYRFRKTRFGRQPLEPRIDLPEGRAPTSWYKGR